MRTILPITLATLTTLAVSTAALGQDYVISFQGYLTVDDEPMNDAGAHLVFRIYELAEDGEPLWTEDHLSVPVDNGVFSVLLGSTVPVTDLPVEMPLWISVAVGEGGELLPRTRLGTVPSSLLAGRLRLPYLAIAGPEGDDAVIKIQKIEEGPGWGDGLDVVVGDADSFPWDVNNMTSDAVDIGFSDGNGVRVGYAGKHAFYSDFSVESALEIDRVGSLSVTTDTSALPNGLEIHGAEGLGVFVGHADVGGMFVNSSDGYGVGVADAGTQGILIGTTGNSGLSIGNTGFDGVWVGQAARNGMYISATVENGVYVESVGNPASAISDTTHMPAAFGVSGTAGSGLLVGHAEKEGVAVIESGADGLYVERAGAGGLHIAEASNNGVYIDSTGFNGIHVRKATTNGFVIADAGDHGLYVLNAGIDGVHVDGAAGWAGYFNGDVKSEGAMWADSYEINSDRRLKQDIHPIARGLDDVLKLHPVEFRWRRRADEGLRLGLIAQEVAEVVPEVVTAPDSKNPFYGVGYAELVPVLIRAIQEQQAEIKLLRAQQEQSTRMLADLSARLDLAANP